MVTIVNSAVNRGMDIEKVVIEIYISGGIPDFRIVGIPDGAVRECKERVRSAIKNSGFDFPIRKIVVNLAPANLRKEGASYDLPIAMGILKATGQILDVRGDFERHIFLGELGLNGNIRGVKGVLPVALHFFNQGYSFVVPGVNAKEAALTGNGCIKFQSLIEVANYFNSKSDFSLELPGENLKINNMSKEDIEYDFSQVKGQTFAKRAIEVAVAGGHNILIKGSPGTGKSMLAKCIPGILPDLEKNEILEITKIYSIAGELDENNPVIKKPPFRSPHHSSSVPGVIGGGTFPRPGEVSLSHYGVLFLDEISEYSKSVLESLREPLEEKEVTISRISGKVKYPSDFILIASMNPCPCGYYGSNRKQCTCTESKIRQYNSKLSGPLLDRIDIIISSQDVEFEILRKEKTSENSSVIKNRITQAREIQKVRYSNNIRKINAGMGKEDIKRHCNLDSQGESLLKEAYSFLNLSARAYDKILRVARTIADLKGNENISSEDLGEAIQYRS